MTDLDWFEFLSARSVDEVNFWQPGGRSQFRALQPGELFLFKLHSPNNFIVGGGLFGHASIVPISLAWEAFGDKNGAASLDEMRGRVARNRREPVDFRTDYSIGCRILEQPFFWPRDLWLPIADRWAPSIVVAVIANQDDERLRGDIDRLLSEGCRVPNARLASCRSKLREEARSRIARAGGGRWRRQDIERIVRDHEGYLANAPELEHYVHPNNWGDLRGTMAKESAAIIIGQSGTGKTLATKMLYDELRKVTPGLTRVPIRLGPSQLRDDTTPPPVLYDIEDSWGRFDFDPNSRPWNDQLGDFLASARPDRMIIATSRLDVAQAAGVLPTIKPWVVGLEAENYDKVARQKLYRSRIDSLPRDLRPLARSSERQVLDNLATPLEIQKFFDALRTQDREGLKNPPGFVGAAIDRAHQDSIELTVIEQIEGGVMCRPPLSCGPS
ncbi:hypothetical protein [Bradyrhizobium sp. SSUT77]|uniref:nSTAND3 domain-containing NTPase n=1 Tax=Bradyrhizobium sp. SSUT77 TaxID=3040603 RepID=UPI00244A33FB|nr:hypothetical protein [Bradyrhizobium sp. SSUT77]MDH2345481.1 hypothetical protein [Bradyrhizobium sp. SSUT77]